MWIERLLKNKPILALAPMADMTDGPFCKTVKKIGGCDIIFREMVSSEAIVRENEKTLKMASFDEVERPMVQQIFGNDPDVMVRAASIIVERFSPDGIDVNMGCPVPKLTKNVGAGAALMKDVDLATSIVKSLRNAKLGVPVTVKTRLGWSDPSEILEFAQRLEETGAELISLHGRTRQQGYAGEADWETIAKVKEKLSIPVMANGDVVTPEDAAECLKITGADGIMIGRGALGNPWIFKEVASWKLPVDRGEKCISLSDRVDTVLEHARWHLEHYGEKGIVTFRKHLAWYFKANKIGHDVPDLKKLRSQLVRVNSLEELKLLLLNLF